MSRQSPKQLDLEEFIANLTRAENALKSINRELDAVVTGRRVKKKPAKPKKARAAR